MGRGLLVFKGDEKAKKKKKKVKHDSPQKTATTPPATSEIAPASTTIEERTTIDSQTAEQSISKPAPPKIQQGTGQITTSGTVVTGRDTRFRRDLGVGDAILVHLPNTQQQEMRIVTMCLSDTSLNLSSSFSQNLSRHTPYQFIRKPRDATKEAAKARQKATETAKVEEQQASGLYGSPTNEMVYREKTEHGSYRIRREKVESNDLTRTDLLEMRAKKKSDKYC